jgi:hypothetical protein
MFRVGRRLQIVLYGLAACAVAIILVVYGRGLTSLFDDKVSSAKIKARDIRQACQEYAVDHGQFPTSLEDLLTIDSDGKGPYLKSDAIKDPWGKIYQYDPNGVSTSGAGVPNPNVFCVAPDGRIIGNGK